MGLPSIVGVCAAVKVQPTKLVEIRVERMKDRIWFIVQQYSTLAKNATCNVEFGEILLFICSCFCFLYYAYTMRIPVKPAPGIGEVGTPAKNIILE
jgi:hypothetical protein